MKTDWERRKILEKQEFTHYVFCKYLGTIFSKTHFCDRLVLIENIIKLKSILIKICFSNLLFFLRNFSTVFRWFLSEFPIFRKTGFSAEIPKNRDRIVCIKSVLSVECIKLMVYIDCNRIIGLLVLWNNIHSNSADTRYGSQ